MRSRTHCPTGPELAPRSLVAIAGRMFIPRRFPEPNRGNEGQSFYSGWMRQPNEPVWAKAWSLFAGRTKRSRFTGTVSFPYPE
jgi:hypothetical protein